ncbi:MAG: cell division protein FtsH, partial [Firmicutes bacterium]|nr:cell division protein FtsH [Bacillota bacterium]
KTFSDQVALEIDTEVRNIINTCYNHAKSVLTENIDLLKLIAKYLLEIETLTKEDIYEIVEKGSLGWWEIKKANNESLVTEVVKVDVEAKKEDKKEVKVNH